MPLPLLVALLLLMHLVILTSWTAHSCRLNRGRCCLWRQEEQHNLPAPLALSDSYLLQPLLRRRRHDREVVVRSLSAAIFVFCALCAVHEPTQPTLLLLLRLAPLPAPLPTCNRSLGSKALADIVMILSGLKSLRALYVLLLSFTADIRQPKARRHKRHDVLPGKKIEKENGIDGDQGVGSEVFEVVVGGKTVEWRAAS